MKETRYVSKWWFGVFVIGIVYWIVSRSIFIRDFVSPENCGFTTSFGLRNSLNLLRPSELMESFGASKSLKIPLHIYQTWETAELPEKMQECVDRLKEKNPEFEHHLFDDKQRLEFIQQYLPAHIAEAYQRIVPGAYRADLWRYCILYIKGGIYLDIKYSNVGDFKLISLTDREYFCRDIEPSGGGIYNAFLVCEPKNEKLWKCIQQIAKNVKTDYYGESALYPTGPMLMKTQFTDEELAEVSRNGLALCEDKCPTKTCICKNGEPILSIYKEYYEKDVAKTPEKRYYELWNEHKIYK
jgi:hypothetical protein